MNYKHIFAIQKQLLKQNVPEDVIPLFFEYIGDLKETPNDLINKQCFYKITHDDIEYCRNSQNKLVKTWKRVYAGHYCTICEKIYDIQQKWEFKKHCKGNVHKRNINKNENTSPPTKKEILEALKHKYVSFWIHDLESKHKKNPKRQIRTILCEKINPYN